jgi:hypothetical protein
LAFAPSSLILANNFLPLSKALEFSMKYLTICISLLVSFNAFACKCDGDSVVKKLMLSDKVFVGTPISGEISNQVVKAEFTVTETIKGKLDSKVVVTTDTSSCGSSITLGQESLVFLDKNNFTYMCTGVHSLRNRKTDYDLDILRDVKKL